MAHVSSESTQAGLSSRGEGKARRLGYAIEMFKVTIRAKESADFGLSWALMFSFRSYDAMLRFQALLGERDMRVLFAFVLFALALTPSRAAGQAAEDERQIREITAKWEEAWNRHDMKAGAELFTEEADFVNVNGNLWKGRQALPLRWTVNVCNQAVVDADREREFTSSSASNS